MVFLKDKGIYVLLITALLAHGLLLLNDGVYWDGWLIFRYIKDQNYDALYQMYKMLGTWGISSFFWSLHYFDNFIFVHKFVVFCCICIANIFAYLIAKRLNSLSDLECLLIGILSIVYSSYQVWHELIMLPATVFYATFYVATYLLMLTCDAQSHVKSVLLRGFSIVLFIISFSLHSILAFYYSAMLLYYVKSSGGKVFDWKQVVSFMKSNALLMVLPVVYWVVKMFFGTPSGLYSNYNGITLDPAKWVFYMVVTLRNSVNTQLSECITNLIEYPLVIVVVGLIICAMQTRISACDEKPPNAVSPKWMLVFGLVALMLAIFPYAAAGRYATREGWATRHSLLMYIPVAIIIIAITKIAWRERISSSSHVHVFLILTLVAGFMITDNRVYVRYQVRWIKDKAFIYILKNHENLKNYTMYLIHDNMDIGIRETYGESEYASMLKEAWGGESRCGIPIHNYADANIVESEIGRVNDYIMSMNQVLRSMFIFGDYQPTNKIINIYVNKKTRDPNLLIFLKYYYYKFSHPDRMDGFLSSIVSIKSCPFVKGRTIQAVDECLTLSEK